MKTKNDLRIIRVNAENHLKRLRKGFRNRAEERSFDHPRRKYNCRKLTLGRIRMRDF